MEGFITRQGDQFSYKGEKFRFIGVNNYPLIVGSASVSSIQLLMDACVRKGIKVIRTWCFDGSFPTTNAAGNFRYLDYPLGTNLLSNGSFETNTNGWTLNVDGGYPNDIARSNDTAHAGSWSLKQVAAYNTYQRFISDAIAVSASTNYTLTFWSKIQSLLSDGSHFPPTVQILDGGTDVEFKDLGILDADNVWKRSQFTFNTGAHTSIKIFIANFGGQNISYFDDFNFSTQQTPNLLSREASFVQVDTVLAEAAKRDLKVILSLSDNPTYNTKQLYCTWVDAIYGTSLEAAGFPYIGFFQNANCKTLYKDFARQLIQRRNTINGMLYVNDPSIFSWELGNELRTDNSSDPGINTLSSTNLALVSLPNGWADEMSRYIHSIDPNHMIGFGDMGHTWQYANGDTVSNGTYYGVDYDYLTRLPYISYLDFHTYPNQSGNQLQEYGQRLGYPNAISWSGYLAQLQDYIKVGHKNNKPVIITEVGFVKEETYSNLYHILQPIYFAFRDIFREFFDMGGDGIILWHGVPGSSATSYDIALDKSGGEDRLVNTDDTNTVNLINRYNTDFNIQKPFQRMFPYEEKQKAARPKSRKPFILDVFKEKEE